MRMTHEDHELMRMERDIRERRKRENDEYMDRLGFEAYLNTLTPAEAERKARANGYKLIFI